MTPPEPLIAHIDLDAFFASVEQRDHPEYRGKAVIVGALPGGRGVVAACSYEARVFGIHSAMPISEAHRRCPDGIYVRPDIARYREESRKIMQVLDELVPAVEKASIDEAYLDIGGLEKILGSPQQIGGTIRAGIVEATGLTASIGIGPNRLIAKLGSEACKPDGLKVVPQNEVLDFLAPMPISNLRGMGTQTLKKISGLNIKTVRELRDTPLATLEASLGQRAAAGFLRQAQGKASSEIVTERQRKSISKETTFGKDVTDTARLRDVLRDLAAQVARTTRREQLAGRVITLKVRYSGFQTLTRQTTLEQPTDDERVLLNTAWTLLKTLLNKRGLPDKPVRLIGVGVSDWGEIAQEQADMFAESKNNETDKKILDAIDTLTDKYGKPLLKVGVSKDN
ncbi:MAG: DNA polymerase IV [Gammaproteobacteria bacterium]